MRRTRDSRHVRGSLLVGAAIVAMAPALASPPPETRILLPLTTGNDSISVGRLDGSFEPDAGPFGLLGPTLLTGVAADSGNDRVTLSGGGTIAGQIAPFRTYLELPGPGPLLDLFLEAPTYGLLVIGADGGTGSDLLANAARTAVSADGRFVHSDFRMGSPGFPAILNSASLDSRLTVTAVGLGGGEGYNRLLNQNRLDVTSSADIVRTRVTLSMADLGDVPQNIFGTARAVGLEGGGMPFPSGERRMVDAENATAGTLIVSALATGTAPDVSITGATLASPSHAVRTIAEADGMTGSIGHDRLANLGRLESSATSKLLGVEVAITPNSFALPEIVMPDIEVESQASALARGLVAGAGRDLLLNAGTLKLAALTEFLTVSIAIGDLIIDASAIEVLIDPPSTPEKPTGGSVAEVAAMLGGADDDRLTSSGSIDGTASSTVETASVYVAAPINSMTGQEDTKLGTLLGSLSLALSDAASSAALAFASGLDGGSGNDILTSGGSLGLAATAQADTLLLTVDVLGFIDGGEEPGAGESGGKSVNLGLDVYNTSTFAYAGTVGVAGGTGDDSIALLPGSATAVSADARARNLDINVGFTTEDKDVTAKGSAVFARLWAGAEATAVTGGAGADAIASDGAVTATATGLSQSLGITANVDLVKTGANISGAFIDTALISEATAVGILAEDAADSVSATAPILVSAGSDAESIGIDLGVTIATEKGMAGSGSALFSTTESRARARGIERNPLLLLGLEGAAGPTLLAPGATLLSTASADLQRIAVGLNVTVAMKGFALGVSLLSADSLASADAAGLTGSAAADAVTAEGAISALATTDSVSSITGVAVAAASQGVGLGVSLLDGRTDSLAKATGADLGGGNDTASLAGVTASATGKTLNNVNSVSISGAKDGVAAGAALARLTTADQAEATGVAAGAGDDSLILAGPVTATAGSEAELVLVGASLGGVMNGVAAGVTLLQAEGRSGAQAIGVALGEGNDRLAMAAQPLGATATADVSGTSVGVSVEGSYQGVGVGVSVMDFSTTAAAWSAGADGGAGDDMLHATGAADVAAQALATDLGVSVAIGGAVYGVGAGGSALMGETVASADAVGLDGGAGADDLLLGGAGSTTATAEATRTSVAVSGSFAIGAALAGNFLDTSATATAGAAGLRGDGLALPGGADRLRAMGNLDVEARATAAGASYAFAIPIGVVPLGATIADGAVEASATAAGQEGGAGDDLLFAGGRVDTAAAASATSISVSVATVGLNWGDFGTRARGLATGLSGGDGADTLVALGAVSTTASALADMKNVGVVLTGVNITDLGLDASAAATGLSGGSGDDAIEASGGVTAFASASTPIESIDVALTGGSLTTVTNSAEARATGLDGGTGQDHLVSARPIVANALATLSADLIAVSITGATGGDLSATGTARATAVDAGAGDDRADLADTSVLAQALASANAVRVALVGAGAGNAGLLPAVAATGFDGGDGADSLVLRGRLTVAGTAIGESASVTVALTGVALGDEAARADARATGATGGAGADSLRLAEAADVAANAAASTGVTQVTLVGGGMSEPGARADAFAAGLTGGTEDDRLETARTLEVSSRATSAADLVTVVLAGGSLAETRIGATAAAVGLDGGEDADTILAGGDLIVSGAAELATLTTTVTGIGLAGSRVERDARASAAGILGGGGRDMVGTAGLVQARATAGTLARIFSVSLLAAGLEGASTEVLAEATAIDLGAGDDALGADGRIDARATASTVGSSGAVGVAQLLVSDSRTDIAATAAGVHGGAGADDIRLAAALDVRADAQSSALSMTASGLGAIATNADQVTQARATGATGDGEDDRIDLLDTGFVRAFASGEAGNSNLSLLGGIGTSLRLRSEAFATGLAGGDGADRLLVAGRLGVEAIALLDADSRSLTVLGGSFGTTGLYPLARATGLTGGGGADLLVNGPGGDLAVSALAALDLRSAALSVVGGALTEGLARADAAAVGMEAGEGDDAVLSSGAAAVSATARVDSRASGFSVVGATGNVTDLRAAAVARGIDAGSGNDAVELTGAFDVAALAIGEHEAASFSAIGLAAGLSAIATDARSVGILTGAGSNGVWTGGAGALTVTANAETSASSSTRVGIGAATGRSALSAFARSTGIEGGTGADTVAIAAPVVARATPFVSIGSTQTSFVGGNGSESAGLARGEARGLLDAAGGTVVEVMAPVTAGVEALAFGSGAASTTLAGTTNLAARIRVEGVAEGLRFDGSGGDQVTIGASVRAQLASTVRSDVTVTSGALFSDGIARTIAETLVEGAGLVDPAGAGAIDILGGTVVEAVALPGDRRTLQRTTFARSVSFGKTDGLDVDAFSHATSFGAATLGGLRIETDRRDVTNRGTITARNQLLLVSVAEGFGNSGVFGEATTDARTIAGASTVVGVDGGKTLALDNRGRIEAYQFPVLAATAIANGTGQGFSDPDAEAHAIANLGGLRSIGVQLLGGEIANSGAIAAGTAPVVDRARSLAQRQPGEGGRVDAFAFVTIDASNSSAFGIRSEGAGAVRILNSGSISAAATPQINALAEAFGTGSDGDAFAQILITALNTFAVGIETGDGDDVIENSGSVSANAAVRIDAAAGARRGNGDPGSRTITPITSSETVGIRTGSGNDQVTNTGLVDAQDRIAIDSGSGDDVVWLGNGSETRGNVLLASGNDLLHLSGKTVIPQLVDGGAGTDQLTAIGDHLLQGSHAGFERVLKQGEGVLDLGANSWTSSDWMRIEQGIVRTRSTGFTSATHTLTAVIQPDGTNGQLLFTGNAAIPRGKAIVEKGGPGPFVDGTVWDVIRSDAGLNLVQLGIVLPDPTAMVSFSSSLFNSRRLRVEVDVKPMAGMAPAGEARSLARALDRATPLATGDVARAITHLQALPTAGEVGAALSAMAPRLAPLSLQSGAAALESALAVTAAASGKAQPLPGLALVAGEGGAGQGWAASFDRAPAFGGTPVPGQVAGYASGVTLALGEGVTLGVAMLQQVTESRDDTARAGGFSRARVSTARLDADLGDGLHLAAAVAGGSTAFRGSRAVPGPAGPVETRLAASAPMVGFDARLGWSLAPQGPLAIEVGPRFAFRHVGLGAAGEAGTAGLAVSVEEARHRRVEGALGIRLALADRPVGPFRLSGQFGTELIHRFGSGGETMTARFHDMPDFRFDLESVTAPRTRVGLMAGLAVTHAETGLSLGLSAARGDARSAGALNLGASLRLGF